MKITKEESMELIKDLLNPRGFMFLFILLVSGDAVDYASGTDKLVITLFMFLSTIGWINSVDYYMTSTRLRRIENKIDIIKEWMK